MKPLRLYRSFKQKVCEDVKGVVIEFTKLAHELVSQHSLMGSGSSIGPWIDGFRNTPVFFEYHRYYQTGDPGILSFLYTFLNFGKKLEYVDKAFDDAAFRSWLDVENGLSDLCLDSRDVASLRTILSLLPSLSDSELWPKHGPGAVSERIGREVTRKHEMIAYDSLIDRFILNGQIGKSGERGDSGYGVNQVIPDPTRWSVRQQRPRLPAKLRFVPKNLKVARSICMEPALLMYFQQAYLRQMVEAIDKSDFSRFIKLRDQSRNRGLSEYGSFSGLIDTLDLSAASDSVSIDLVKQVFPADWLIPMLVTRSSQVELPDGSVKTIKKFAPMGSALCFPTQCLIFVSVCIYAAVLHQISASTDEPVAISLDQVEQALQSFSQTVLPYNPNGRRLQPLAVYGDDICCDSTLTAHVKSILSRLGFHVNDDKSFTGSQSFRESCGGFYLLGCDISPLYFTIKEVREKLTPNHIASHVHLINESRLRGFKRLYGFLIHTIKRWHLPPWLGREFSVPFVLPTSTEFGIHVSEDRDVHEDNTHLRKRVNASLQRGEWRVWTIAPKDYGRGSPIHDKYLMMRWWATRHDHHFEDISIPQGHNVPVGHRVQWRWTPLY
jgi:hypothetical protein